MKTDLDTFQGCQDFFAFYFTNIPPDVTEYADYDDKILYSMVSDLQAQSLQFGFNAGDPDYGRRCLEHANKLKAVVKLRRAALPA